ncbi:MAG: alpha/beta fold hydrolase [Acidimicrobiia bacterium]
MALRSFVEGALFAEVFGEDPPRILALHGWGRRGRDFSPSLDDLEALAPDLPGFGSSPPPDEVIGAEGYARIVAKVLPVFAEPPVVVGHSFGGRVAVCLAAQHPDRVGPLVLTGAPLVRLQAPGRPSLGYRAIRALHRKGLVSDATMESLRQRRGSADYRAASGVMRSILVKVINESYEDQLKVFSRPVRLLWGSEDREVPVEVARRSVELLREGGSEVELRVVEGVGHHLPLEAPEELRRAIKSFLA